MGCFHIKPSLLFYLVFTIFTTTQENLVNWYILLILTIVEPSTKFGGADFPLNCLQLKVLKIDCESYRRKISCVIR